MHAAVLPLDTAGAVATGTWYTKEPVALPTGVDPRAIAQATSTRYSALRMLLPRYWLPSAGQGRDGRSTVGFITSSEDILGRHIWEASALVQPERREVDGYAVYRFAGLGVPVVLSCRPGQPVNASFVDVDQRAGARLAVDRLAALGRRHLATITGPLDMPAAQDRLAGFTDAVAAHGVPPVRVEGDFTYGGGERAVRELLRDLPDVDGIFVGNDLMARGALRVLQESGRRVPQDVAVIGFDDSTVALECHPPLSTVHQPVEEMSGEMAKLLLNRIREPSRPPRSVIFNPQLVLRASA